MKKLLISLSLAATLALTGCTPNGADTSQAATETAPPSATASPARTAVASAPVPSPPAVQKITPADALALIGSEGVTLLDVRERHEYDEAHIKGAVLVPYDTISDSSPELPADKDHTLIVYCRSGRRSAIAAESLIALGYTNVYDLGGIQNWPYDTITP